MPLESSGEYILDPITGSPPRPPKVAMLIILPKNPSAAGSAASFNFENKIDSSINGRKVSTRTSLPASVAISKPFLPSRRPSSTLLIAELSMASNIPYGLE